MSFLLLNTLPSCMHVHETKCPLCAGICIVDTHCLDYRSACFLMRHEIAMVNGDQLLMKMTTMMMVVVVVEDH